MESPNTPVNFLNKHERNEPPPEANRSEYANCRSAASCDRRGPPGEHRGRESTDTLCASPGGDRGRDTRTTADGASGVAVSGKADAVRDSLLCVLLPQHLVHVRFRSLQKAQGRSRESNKHYRLVLNTSMRVITLRLRRRHVKQLNLPFLPKELFPVIGLLGSDRRLLEVVSRLLSEAYRLRLVVMVWKTDCPIWMPSSPA